MEFQREREKTSKMPSPVQLHRFNTNTEKTVTNAIANGLNCPKQSQTLRFTTVSSTKQTVPETVANHHTQVVEPNQCFSIVIQHVNAPISTVWSVVRRFDNPQAYKNFVKSCHVITTGNDVDGIRVGSLREVRVVSGLPAVSSTERLEILDDERHVISFSVVGGDHRLTNYRSVTTLHGDGYGGTVVIESYVVDVPHGNTKEETCSFVDTIVRCNLQSLAQIAENMNAHQH